MRRASRLAWPVESSHAGSESEAADQGEIMSVGRAALRGAAAGAAGTTALNAVTYLDMTIRARAASSTPEASVEKLSDKLGIGIPGEGKERDNRVQGLGPLLGIATG